MFKIALCQMFGSKAKDLASCKAENNQKSESMIREAAKAGAQIVALPEIWNSPYSQKVFREASEPADGATVQWLAALAKELSIYLVAGSIPEIDNDKIYNTCFIFNKAGEVIGKHRKVHLFDIDVKGGIKFTESKVLSPGDDITIVDTEFCKVGVAICYDVRFPEIIRKMALAGAKLVILPAAFNMTTGPAHWDITMRTRALDNQIYFAAVSPARDMTSKYIAYGNSCVASPWGDFIAHAGEDETILYADIDLDYLDSIREQLPLLKHRRPELY